MIRHGLMGLFVLFCACACSEWTRVPPPPVTLTLLDAPQASASSEGSGTTLSGPHVRLVRAVSPASLVTVHLPDIAGTGQRFKGTSLYKLLTSDEVTALFGEAGIDFSLLSVTGMPGGTGPGGMDLRKLQRALGGELVLSLEELEVHKDGRAPNVRALAALTVTGAEHEMRQFLDFVTMLASQDKSTQVEQGALDGTAFTRIRTRKGPMPLDIEMALFRNALLIGVGKEVVTDAILRLKDETVQALPDQESFGRSMQRISDANDAIRVHVDLAGFVSRFGDMLPTEAQQVLDFIGAQHIKAIAGAVRIEGEDLVSTSFLDSPGGTDFLTGLMRRHPIDFKFLDHVPASATGFSLFPLDGQAVLDHCREKLPPQAKAELEEGLAQMREEGVDVEKDILSVFGPRVALVSVPAGRTDAKGLDVFWNQLLGTGFLIEVQDRKRALVQIARLPRSGDQSLRFEERIGGTHVIGYRFPMQRLPADFGVYIAPVGEYVAVALSREAMRQMLRRPDPDAAEHFRKELSGLPKNVVAAGYDDMSRGSGLLLNVMAQKIAEANPKSGGESGSEGSGSWADLPFGDFNPSVSYTVADENGILSVTRSPTGGLTEVGGLTGAFVAASIALPNLTQARVEANEKSAIESMHAIRAAQAEARLERIRDSDGDGQGEHVFLSDLLGSEDGSNPLNASLTGFKRAKLGWKKAGYYFVVYLPAEDGSPIAGIESPARRQEVDGDLAESIAIVVAWPRSGGSTGRRSFILDAQGVIRYCLSGYGGKMGPSPDLFSTQPGNLAATPISNRDKTRDGHSWLELR
ncbi:MAG: hypothetical protein ACYTGZ_03440 [Planctomycetota bacterium]|jgi:hypothetical protein